MATRKRTATRRPIEAEIIDVETTALAVREPETRTRTRARAETRTREAREFQVINVRVGLLPGEMKDIILNGERTVRAAMTGAEIDTYEADGHEVRVNGQPSDLETVLKEGDTVIFVRSIEGN